MDTYNAADSDEHPMLGRLIKLGLFLLVQGIAVMLVGVVALLVSFEPGWSICSSFRTNSEKRQQKHPPVISCAGNPAASARRVSTSSPPWSFKTMPTRRPIPRRRSAAPSMSVVLPAPRNPPIRIR